MVVVAEVGAGDRVREVDEGPALTPHDRADARDVGVVGRAVPHLVAVEEPDVEWTGEDDHAHPIVLRLAKHRDEVAHVGVVLRQGLDSEVLLPGRGDRERRRGLLPVDASGRLRERAQPPTELRFVRGRGLERRRRIRLVRDKRIVRRERRPVEHLAAQLRTHPLERYTVRVEAVVEVVEDEVN